MVLPLKLPVGLKQFVVSYSVNPVSDDFEPVLIGDKIITAKTKESAWGKFCEQFFGVLKPNPGDYTVREVK